MVWEEPPFGYGYPYAGYPGYVFGPPPVPHIGHKNHMCDMVKNGSVFLEQMKALVKDSKFICKKCGRAAAKEENLCEPIPL